MAHVWHVEPIGETREVFRLEESRWVLLGAWRGAQRSDAANGRAKVGESGQVEDQSDARVWQVERLPPDV